MRFITWALLVSAAACTQAAAPLENFRSVDAPVVALTHVRVIDGTGAPGRAEQTILVRSGRIAEVGDSQSIPVPQDARIFDLSGRTVLPGYVMVHEHLFYTPDGNGETEMPVSFPRLYLAAGVTTIRTGGSIDLGKDSELQRDIDQGRTPGPRLHLTSRYLDGPRFGFIFESPEGRGRRMVAKWADQGATSFKAYEHLTRGELRGVIAEAHERGLKVTGHLCAVTFSEAADLGIDNLEHGLWVATDFVKDKQPDACPPSNVALGAMLRADQWEIRKLIDKLVGRQVAITSTLPVFETFLSTRDPAPHAALEFMSPKALERYLRRRADIAAAPNPVWGDLLRKEMAFELAFARAGGLLVAGTDPTGRGGVVAGFSNKREIKLLVEAGFTPVEAIQIATFNGARLLGVDREIGSIAKGKRADLVVIRGNPEDSIADIEYVESVFKNGIGYDPVRLMDSVRGLVGAQ